VVLTYGLVGSGREYVREPNIFEAEDLPPGVLVGHINLPKDHRQIPLRMTSWEWDHGSQKGFDSFAFQAASAFEEITAIEPMTKDSPRVKTAIEEGRFLYGGFVSDVKFPKISAQDLLAGDAEAKRRCNGRIVVIGGTWHKSGGRGGPVEEFPSPNGAVPGLYLHANYIESLIDNRFGQGVPGWLAVIVDVVLGLLIYVGFFCTRARRLIRLLALLLMLMLLTFVPYLLAVSFGRYFGFTPALSLCILHLLLEHFRVFEHLREFWKLLPFAKLAT